MKQITKIKTIGQFGAFKRFAWNLKMPDGQKMLFKPLNFIYGRNYSGKTTLSKILQAFELKQLPAHYDGAAFELEFSDGSVLNATQVGLLDTPVRVFNRDFVNENLAFLRDTSEEGAIKAFAVLGKGSDVSETEIKELSDKLGVNNAEKSTGLYLELLKETATLTERQRECEHAVREVKGVKVKIASERPGGIRHKPWCGDQDYNITKLDRDILLVSQKDYQPITIEEVDRLKRIVGDAVRPTIQQPELPRLKLTQFLADAQSLLSRVVVQQEAIEDFINDSEREAWARKGYELHKDNHVTCAFCGQTIPDQRWIALRKHFENEAEDLRRNIEHIVPSIETELRGIDNWFNLDERAFYAALESRAKEIKLAANDAVKDYRAALNGIILLLKKRLQSVATPCTDALPADVSKRIEKVHQELVALIKEHNKFTTTLSSEQKNAKDALRLYEVYSALQTGELSEMTKLLDAKEYEKGEQSRKVNELTADIREKEARRSELRRMRHDESQAANLINLYLAWTGENNALTLEPKEIVEDGVASKVFQVTRNGVPAFNLSDGECNLIAFCYFLAKLSSPELKDNKPIIWIDDPISSLDLNHIYFVYAMIRGVILNEKRYGQLFISTHNLEFMRYLMRMADWEIMPNGKEVPVKSEWFFVRQTPNGSSIEELPKYLKYYITEFVYLFTQIYDAAASDPSDDSYEKLIYGFGNAARRFLEIYLYFKFPNDLADDKTEHTRRMSTFFGDNVCGFMVNRVINEMSHEPGAFERAMAPMDSSEVHSVARVILQKIKDNDKKQYEHLLKGIGKEDPLETGTLSQS